MTGRRHDAGQNATCHDRLRQKKSLSLCDITTVNQNNVNKCPMYDDGKMLGDAMILRNYAFEIDTC